jgi:hypothetical protein
MSSIHPTRHSSLAFDAAACVVYTGDADGVTKAWPMRRVLKRLGEPAIDFGSGNGNGSGNAVTVAAGKDGLQTEGSAAAEKKTEERRPGQSAAQLVQWANARYHHEFTHNKNILHFCKSNDDLAI